jgi:hypothetical protein
MPDRLWGRGLRRFLPGQMTAGQISRYPLAPIPQQLHTGNTLCCKYPRLCLCRCRIFLAVLLPNCTGRNPDLLRSVVPSLRSRAGWLRYLDRAHRQMDRAVPRARDGWHGDGNTWIRTLHRPAGLPQLGAHRHLPDHRGNGTRTELPGAANRHTEVTPADIGTAIAMLGFTRNLSSAISIVIGGVIIQNQMVAYTDQFTAAGIPASLVRSLVSAVRRDRAVRSRMS